jgi:phosphoribosyl 1,2-cyclic phosphodiesterase
VPTPGSRTIRYGGNTPCVSLELVDHPGHGMVVLDAGTGIRLLGNELSQRATEGVEVDLLLSHTHWDHIQGLPFFAPLFDGGNAVRIWGPQQGNVSLETILRRQMEPMVFPVPLDGLAARLTVEHVTTAELQVGGFSVSSMQLRHPGKTLAYRLTPLGGGPSVVYATDNELGNGGAYDVGPTWRQEFVRFLQGIDMLVHDAMFMTEEIDRFQGWGHSSPQEALDLAVEAGVKRLVMFHHSPERDDAALDELVEVVQTKARSVEPSLEVVAATEGTELMLDGG